jgi:transposase-like protein
MFNEFAFPKAGEVNCPVCKSSNMWASSALIQLKPGECSQDFVCYNCGCKIIVFWKLTVSAIKQLRPNLKTTEVNYVG